MVPQYQVRLTPRTISDLRDIFHYIERFSHQNARRMVKRLFDAMMKLEILPYRYAVPRVGVVKDKEIRCMVVRPYLVFYRIDEDHKQVFILHVRHGARGG